MTDSAAPRPAVSDLQLIEPADVAHAGSPLLALNNAHAAELSLLSPGRFADLVAEAFMAERLGRADAFLLAFDQDARYDSPNFLWLRNRLARFVYVDRVVVAPARRGQGLARRLYAELFSRARAAGHVAVTCEVNVLPPNPVSDAFHAALGFVPIGSAALGHGKTVRYFRKDLGEVL